MGHDAVTVLDQAMGGSPDTQLVVICKHEERILLTLDLDFADIRTYPPEAYPGLIVFRLQRQDKKHVLAALRRMLSLFDREPIDGHLWIIEEERVRIRG